VYDPTLFPTLIPRRIPGGLSAVVVSAMVGLLFVVVCEKCEVV
jgi:hypothetical protein